MANGLGIERGRTVQARIDTGFSQPKPTTGEGLGSSPTEEAEETQSAYEVSEALSSDDDNETSTLTYYDDDKEESKTVSIKKEDSIVPLKNEEGRSIGAVDISKGAVDLYTTDEGLYKGLDISFSDEKFSIPIGDLRYEDTPSGKKGLTFKLGKGKIYTDADVDLLDFENAPMKANAGFVLNFAEGGSVPDTKPMQMEMDLILSKTKDPVSGNTAPLGATPEEVRDDIPINASPNEFMINAATRRYYGTEFFEELQKAAAEGWERIKKGEESYFRDDELEVEDDEKGQDKPINMQEGGAIPEREIPEPVGGGYGGYGGVGLPFLGFELRTFADPNNPNRKIRIAFFNGRPITRIPKDFVESDVETDDDAPVQTTAQGDTRDRRELGYELKTSYREKDVNDWSDFDYAQYYSDTDKAIKSGQDITKLSNIEKGIVFATGMGLTGGLFGGIGLNRLAEKNKYNTAVKIFNNTKGLINKGNLEEEYGKVIKYTNYMLGKELGFFEERNGKLYEGDIEVVEPERPDISIMKRYSDKPKSGLDFNPNTSAFESQYDRDEALQGTFGSRARYLASQEVHSQGLRTKDPSLGIEDTSYFGSNVGPVEAVTNLVTTGTVQGDDNNDDDRPFSAPSQSSGSTSSGVGNNNNDPRSNKENDEENQSGGGGSGGGGYGGYVGAPGGR